MATTGSMTIKAPLFMYLNRRLVQVGAADITLDVTATPPRRELVEVHVPISLQDVPGAGQE